MNGKTRPGSADGPTSMAEPVPLLCRFKRPAQLSGTEPGRDDCHGTRFAQPAPAGGRALMMRSRWAQAGAGGRRRGPARLECCRVPAEDRLVVGGACLQGQPGRAAAVIHDRPGGSSQLASQSVSSPISTPSGSPSAGDLAAQVAADQVHVRRFAA